MKYLILACAILGVLCSKISCMNVAQNDQVPFELIKEPDDSVAVPIPLMEQPVIQPSEQIVLARGYFSIDCLYDVKTNSVCEEPFLARLSSVISSPCELVFNFDKSLCEMKLIRYMCRTIENSEHVGNVHSVVVEKWDKSPTSKDFAAFKSMLVALPNLKKLEICAIYRCSLTFSINYCVKHLEYAKLKISRFSFQNIDNFMDYLSYFAFSHPNLNELDLLGSNPLEPKEAVILMESMQLNSFVFQLSLSDCSAEDVDAINSLKFKCGLKSISFKALYMSNFDNGQNAEKFLFEFALKLDCLEELSVDFSKYYNNERVYKLLFTFIHSLPHPELLTKLRVIWRESKNKFYADMLERVCNLKELDLVNFSLALPRTPFHKLRALILTDCDWKGCLASAFPSVTDLSLLGCNVKSHGYVDYFNYVIVLLGGLSVDQFTIKLELRDYLYFCKNVVAMKTKESKFNGMLNIQLESVCGGHCTPVEDAFANLTISVFRYFDNSFVKLTMDRFYATVPMIESLIKNVGKLNSIHVDTLVCYVPLPFEKNGESLSWESEYYDATFNRYLYKKFTCANK